MLIEYGVNVNARRRTGWTPLHEAARLGAIGEGRAADRGWCRCGREGRCGPYAARCRTGQWSSGDGWSASGVKRFSSPGLMHLSVLGKQSQVRERAEHSLIREAAVGHQPEREHERHERHHRLGWPGDRAGPRFEHQPRATPARNTSRCATGTQKSGAAMTSSPRKLSGMMPTIRNVVPFTRTLLSSTPGSAPQCWLHAR